jgi:hypothetical protein
MTMTYKVVETAVVDDATLERILNETAAEGWAFDGFHFAMQPGSRRPTMAFVLFSRETDDEPGAEESR